MRHLHLPEQQISDIQHAARQLTSAKRRAYQARITQQYCAGHARQAEKVFGWSRQSVALGLHEQRTGLVCFTGSSSHERRWEHKYPEVSATLWEIADQHSQQDPSFRTAICYTRLTVAETLKQLRLKGIDEGLLPSPSSMAEILNRNGYRLRPVEKAKPQKNS